MSNNNNNNKPLGVKAVSLEDTDKKEMEAVYRELSKRYCVCQHKKEVHVNGEYECKFSGMTFSQGYIQEYQCQCNLFQSIEGSATLTPEK